VLVGSTSDSLPSQDELVLVYCETPGSIVDVVAEMMTHAMGIQLAISKYLNPDQITVKIFDILLYALSKHVKWQWPNSFGEGKFLSMAGGMHIEKSLWILLIDTLDGSRWCSV